MEKTLTAKALKALEILKEGGYFKYALEKGYLGREQFQWHLHTKTGFVVKGYGAKTAHELEHLMKREFGAAFTEYWRIAGAPDIRRKVTNTGKVGRA